MVGQDGASVLASMQKAGWIVSQTPVAAPPTFLLPSALPPATGQVWQTVPAAGTVAPDGRVTVYVQP